MRPAFSNGTEFMFFEDCNCSQCVKASRYNEKKDEYTKFRCKVQEEIIKAAVSDGMVSDRVADITYDFTLHGRNCKYLKTERKKYVKQNKNQIKQRRNGKREKNHRAGRVRNRESRTG